MTELGSSISDVVDVPEPTKPKNAGRLALSIGLMVSIAGSGVAMAMGGTPLPFLISVCVALTVSFKPSAGGALALPAAILGTGLASFGLLLVSGFLGDHLVAVQAVGLGFLGLVASGVIAMDPRPLDLAPTRSRAALVGALVGPTVWLAGLAAAWRKDSSYAIAWTMSGDARPNFLGGRVHADQGGILLRELRGAPATQGLMSVFMAPGRDWQNGIELLMHDVVRVTQAWTVFITLTCLLMGLLAALFTRSETPITRVGVAAGASLVPLSWYVLGSGLENGFANASLALALVSATWIIVAFAQHSRPVAVSGLVAGLVLLLETWYPMAVLPAAMLVAVLMTWATAPQITSRQRALAVMVGAFFAAVTAGLICLPLVSQEVQKALALEGGIYGLPRYFFLVAGGVAVVLAAGAVQERSGTTLFWATSLTVVASVGMVIVLLWTRRATPLLWGYYPVKFAWLLASAFLMIVVALLAFGLSRAPRPHQRGIGFLAGCLAAWALGATLTIVPGAMNPVRFIQLGWGGPNGFVVDEVIDASERGPNRVLWNYYDAPNDRIGNFWLTVASSTIPEAVPWAFTHDPTSLEALCALGRAGPVTAVTRDPALDEELEKTCPEAEVMVETPK